RDPAGPGPDAAVGRAAAARRSHALPRGDGMGARDPVRDDAPGHARLLARPGIGDPDVKICVVGTGYVGLVTGACFADLGHDVVCVDVVAEKVEKLRGGQIPIYEPGLDEVVRRGLDAGRLRFTTDLGEGAGPAQFVFICVPAPPAEDGSADLSHVERAAVEIASHIGDYKVIINKSTVPIGSSRIVERIVRERLPAQIDFDVASNPELLRE